MLPTTVSTYQESKHGELLKNSNALITERGRWSLIKTILESECSCPYFLKHSICRHDLGMQIRLKLVDPTAVAKIVPLGQK